MSRPSHPYKLEVQVYIIHQENGVS